MTNVILNSIKRLIPQDTLDDLGTMVNELVAERLVEDKKLLNGNETTAGIVLLKVKDNIFIVDAAFDGDTMVRTLRTAKLTDFVNNLVNKFLCSSKN